MAKKKLFGNRKEPRCETCAHGKLSANGDSVLCIQGGALPLSHSCRRYQYDPLRRVPKRRPLLGEYSAADFALDEQTAPADPVTSDASADVTEPAQAVSHERTTFENLFEYLEQHDTPDAETILAILSKTYSSEEDTPTDPASEAETETENIIEQQAAEAATALDPDDSPDILSDLARLDLSTVPAFALTPIADTNTESEPLLLSDADVDEVMFLADAADEDEAPLSTDDLVFLPKEPEDDEDNETIIGFTPLTGDE